MTKIALVMLFLFKNNNFEKMNVDKAIAKQELAKFGLTNVNAKAPSYLLSIVNGSNEYFSKKPKMTNPYKVKIIVFIKTSLNECL